MHIGELALREETWTTWKKVYRYAPDGEAPRHVAMDCGEYTLSTAGGRRLDP
jgi:hypothetical protein